MKNSSVAKIFILFGVIATGLTIITNVPTVVKIMLTNSTTSLSLSSYILFILSNLFWALYGYYYKSTSLIISSLVSMFLQIFIVHYILKNSSLDRNDYKKHVIGNVKKDYHYRYL